jgi:hypothetical protein
MEHLPAELLYQIFSYLNIKDRLEFMISCKTLESRLKICPTWSWLTLPSQSQLQPWHKGYLFGTIITHGPLLKYFDASKWRDFTDVHLLPLARHLQTLENLDIQRARLNSTAMKTFFNSNADSLFSINLSDIGFLDDGALIAMADHCPNLVSCNLSRVKSPRFGDTAIVYLANNRIGQSLKYLNLNNCNTISNHAVMAIGSKCINLESFVCSGVFLLEDTGVHSLLLGCKRLNTLDVSYCWRLSDHAFSVLGLQVASDYICGARLASLSARFCFQLHDPTISHVLRAPNLLNADFSNCQEISERALSELEENLLANKILP